MALETARTFLLWCFVINYAILVVWFLMFWRGRNWIHRFHGECFRMSTEQFDAIHYLLLGIYKIGLILFVIVPYVALSLIE
ncbi:MAG: hypothetical protein O2955_13765 [Planctomycetota bacterium]|nr:hypothetical protein [Planctomycetota bacterium]MDA1213577.1 hypothetical protein [Planctomycetota bacterium]